MRGVMQRACSGRVGGRLPRRATRSRRRLPGGHRRALAILGVALLCGGLGLSGCNDEDDCICCGSDRDAPSAPRGLYSITGDDRVTLVWLANPEPDVARYEVWWSTAYEGTYELIRSVPACGDCYWMDFHDNDAVNGETYFYAVSAVDHAGNESALSGEFVWDTPREDGRATIGNALVPSEYAWAGFDLDAHAPVAADDGRAHFFYTFEASAGGFLWAGSDVPGGQGLNEIQDMGYTADFDEIDFAPDNRGWSPSGTAEPIAGHTYVLLTSEDYYAKIRIDEDWEEGEALSFRWAYQDAEPFNRQLAYPVAP